MCAGRRAAFVCLIGCLAGPCSRDHGSPGVVVYNSQSTGSTLVRDAYLAAHPDLPAANVLDLNSATIAKRADVSYAEFVTYIRDPIRAYLTVAGDPTPAGIVSICLIPGCRTASSTRITRWSATTHRH